MADSSVRAWPSQGHRVPGHQRVLHSRALTHLVCCVAIMVASLGGVARLNAAAGAIDCVHGAETLRYGVTVSGAAQALLPATGSGAGLPAGAAPVNLTGAARSCNAYLPTAPISVTLVGLPMDKAVT